MDAAYNPVNTQQGTKQAGGAGGLISGGLTAAQANPSPMGGGQPAAPIQPVQQQINQSTGTVQGRVQSLLQQDSPIYERARAIAREATNNRGLIKSSLAGEAAMNAVLDKALPIAQQDAQAEVTVGSQNTSAQNSFLQLAQQHQNTLQQMGLQSNLTTSQVPQQFAASIAQANNDKIAAIMSDSQLDADSKRAAIANLVDGSNASLAWAEKFYGVSMSRLSTPTNSNNSQFS